MIWTPGRLWRLYRVWRGYRVMKRVWFTPGWPGYEARRQAD